MGGRGGRAGGVEAAAAALTVLDSEPEEIADSRGEQDRYSVEAIDAFLDEGGGKPEGLDVILPFSFILD